MKYLILLSFGFLVFIPSVSRADIVVEPYASAGVSLSSHKDDEKPFMSYAGGARLGYSFLILSAGLDFSYTYHGMGSGVPFASVVVHKPNQSQGFSQAGDNVSIQYSKTPSSFQPLSIGVFAGVDLPLFFDCYGAAFFSLGKKDYSLTGYGLKAGLSYLSIPLVKLNAELQWAYYTGKTARAGSKAFHLFSAMLSVSLPFSFEMDFFGEEDGGKNLRDSSSAAESEEYEF